MDLSSHSAFAETRRTVAAAGSDRVETSLQRQKAERESDLMGTGLAASVTLLAQAWFIGAFWPMLAVVALRTTAELSAQWTARAMIVRLSQGEAIQHLKRRSEFVVFFAGAGWGMAIWPIQGAGLAVLGAVLIFLAVQLSAVVAMILTVPSPDSFKRWLAGWLAAVAAPALAGYGTAQTVVALTCAVYAYALLWLSRRLHLQLRQMIALQFENQDLAGELGELNAALAHSLALAERNARRDSLTGLPNRRAFEEAIVKLHQDSGTVGRHLLLIDLDHFKSINDRFGHASGDVVLASVSVAIEGQMRAGECCARWGGEEFVALLLECDVDAALARVESLRRQIGAMIVPGLPEAAHPVTASIGIAPWQAQETLESVVARADEAMYQAKNHGRNRAFYAGLFAGPGLSHAQA